MYNDGNSRWVIWYTLFRSGTYFIDIQITRHNSTVLSTVFILDI